MILLSVAPTLLRGAELSLVDLSLEELAPLEITSVCRRAERLSDAAASVYVVTAEAIRRSGATSLPQVLRVAPNLQGAQVSASQCAISARGFNNAIGNKLLVLVDGRTVYTPFFSGVFWDQQDLPLQDVERIEVISGPGRHFGARMPSTASSMSRRTVGRDTVAALDLARCTAEGGEEHAIESVSVEIAAILVVAAPVSPGVTSWINIYDALAPAARRPALLAARWSARTTRIRNPPLAR